MKLKIAIRFLEFCEGEQADNPLQQTYNIFQKKKKTE